MRTDDFEERRKGIDCGSIWLEAKNERKSQHREMNAAQATIGARQREEIAFGENEADTGSKWIVNKIGKGLHF